MQQWNKSILLGCAVIAAALVLAGGIAGGRIADRLYTASSQVPGSFTVYSGDNPGQSRTASEYMSQWEAADYIRLDYDAFEKLLYEGELSGAFVEFSVEKTAVDEQAYADMLKTVPEGAPSPAPPVIRIPGVERVFVKDKLDEWMTGRIVP